MPLNRAKPMPKVNGRSERAVQEALDSQRRQANAHPLAEARLIEGVVIEASDKTVVKHQLGRVPKRILSFVALNATSAPLYEVESSRTAESFEIGNNGGSAVTVDLLVM